MTRPTPGKQYTVVKDDTLSHIAAIAYGDGTKWPKIWKANQTTLKSDDPDLIFPGEVIFIPGLLEVVKLKNENLKRRLENQGSDAVTLILDDIIMPTQAISVTRTMDTAADGWNASIAWNPGEDERIDNATKPYGYQDALVYIGGNLQVTGALYGVEPSLNNSSRGKNLEGWSYTADAIDSTIKPPYEVNKTTLKQRAIDLMEGFGINVQWDVEDDLLFDKMTAAPTDTIFSHLLKYAKQRGVLISSTITGDLQFLRANVNGKSIGTIEEGKQGFLNYTAKFDGRKRFNSYKAIGQSPKKNNKFAIAKDDKVPKSRMLTFKAPDSTEGDMKSAAEWRRSAQLSEALTIPFDGDGFYAPNGEIWKENEIVTVKSPVLSIPEGFNFLIKRVNLKKESSGNKFSLSLVPPQVYSGEPIPDIFK
jgi:prophage tail gpP-like protein